MFPAINTTVIHQSVQICEAISHYRLVESRLDNKNVPTSLLLHTKQRYTSVFFSSHRRLSRVVARVTFVFSKSYMLMEQALSLSMLTELVSSVAMVASMHHIGPHGRSGRSGGPEFQQSN